MRGWRLIGRASDSVKAAYNPDDILAFSPTQDVEDMRDGFIRARDFNMAACWASAVAALCPDDFVFVATAIGEDAFG